MSASNTHNYEGNRMVFHVSPTGCRNLIGEHGQFAGLRIQMICVVATSLLSGCGSTSDLAPVTGIVTVDGKPVAGAQVLFTSPNHRPAAGESDAEGRYELSTYETGDGAAIGSYTVTVTARPTIQVNAAGTVGPTTGRRQIQHGIQSPVPLKYSDAANPLLTVEVQPGENEIPLELKHN